MDQMTPGDRQSILTEIKVLAMLHHPNIIGYFENFLQDKAMLYDLLETRRREEEELAHLFAQKSASDVLCPSE